MNSTHIQEKITDIFQNYDYKLYNSFVFNWESDFFCISKSGYCVEVEVKISKSDFKADYQKRTSCNVNKHEFLNSDHTSKPNKFYFACPHGLIKQDEINLKYGLIWIEETKSIHGIYRSAKIIREAKFLHKNKILDSKHVLRQLLNKFYYRNMDLRKLNHLRECELKHGQGKIDFYNY